jgi:hypothetical protein
MTAIISTHEPAAVALKARIQKALPTELRADADALKALARWKVSCHTDADFKNVQLMCIVCSA